MRIQHNIAAMSSYRNYTNNVSAVNKNLEKLSSGYKINRAGDDAAGLAISEKMRAQITGLDAASKNAKDGISLVKTAEGALQEVHDMLNRMTYLATQSANGTYDNATDRFQLQKEVDQLKTEINRIADSANFNGIKLLDGSMDRNAVTQIGVGVTPIADGDQSVVTGAKGVYSFDLKDYRLSGSAEEAAKGTFEEGTKTTETATTTGTDTPASTDWTSTAAGTNQDTTLDGKKFVADIDGVKFTVNLVKTGTGDGGAAADDEVIVGATDSNKDIADAIKANLEAQIKAHNDAGAAGTTDYKKIENLQFDAKNDGSFDVKADVTPMTYKTDDGTAKGTFEAGTKSVETATTTGTDTPASTDWTDTAAGTNQDTTLDGKKFVADIDGVKFTVNLVKTGTGDGGAAADDEVVVGGTDSNKDIADAIKANLEAQIKAHNDAGAAGTTDYKKIENLSFDAKNDGSFDVTADVTPQTYKEAGKKGRDGGAGGDEIKITVGGKELALKTGADAVLTGVVTGEKLASQIDTTQQVELVDGVKYNVSVSGTKVTLRAEAAPEDDTQIPANMQVLVTNGANNSWDRGLHADTPAAVDKGQKVAQGEFDLRNGIVQDGNILTIGDTTYTFRVGRNGTGAGDNVIDLSSYEADDANLLKVAAQKLSQVGNNMFDVTTSGGTKITLTEKMGTVNYVKDWDLKGTAGVDNDAAWNAPASGGNRKTGVVTYAVSNGRGLTLQIGDTADSFNQLKVSIGDCHTDAMGIGNISIGDQDSAAKAVDAIKNAINYVSDVRGTLGATQNRLEHTINNLSVMKENIQDAESTIRDTDIAEEMMAYTKNNILVQSAQAMLAQANQIPQGVLQLLG